MVMKNASPVGHPEMIEKRDSLAPASDGEASNVGAHSCTQSTLRPVIDKLFYTTLGH